MIQSGLWNRIAKAARTPPTTAGGIATLQALTAVAAATWGAHATNHTAGFLKFDLAELDFPSISKVSTTFLRTLVVPSLVEEVLWRVVLQPPGASWTHMLGVNLIFVLYHTIGSVFLAEQVEDRHGAKAFFCDPAFLSLAFFLGNSCSWTWVRSGYALWAPVLTHAVPVTVWLTFLHGDEALSTPGGLQGSKRQP
jgi:predicted Abi (CAAX) family protease